MAWLDGLLRFGRLVLLPSIPHPRPRLLGPHYLQLGRRYALVYTSSTQIYPMYPIFGWVCCASFCPVNAIPEQHAGAPISFIHIGNCIDVITSLFGRLPRSVSHGRLTPTHHFSPLRGLIPPSGCVRLGASNMCSPHPIADAIERGGCYWQVRNVQHVKRQMRATLYTFTLSSIYALPINSLMHYSFWPVLTNHI
jgi:hypothetical protein